MARAASWSGTPTPLYGTGRASPLPSSACAPSIMFSQAKATLPVDLTVRIERFSIIHRHRVFVTFPIFAWLHFPLHKPRTIVLVVENGVVERRFTLKCHSELRVRVAANPPHLFHSALADMKGPWGNRGLSFRIFRIGCDGDWNLSIT